MYEIPLKNTPNQEVSVTIGGIFYTIRLKYYSPDNNEGIMFSQIKLGNNDWYGAVRLVPNQALLPYKYQVINGNFYLVCLDNEYPNYKKFGKEHKLIYLSNTELEIFEGK